MGDRRFQLVEASDEDDEDSDPPSLRGESQAKRRKVQFLDDGCEDDGSKDVTMNEKNEKNEMKNGERSSSAKEISDCEKDEREDPPRPLGEAVKVSVKGKQNVNHYTSFEYDGLRYQIEDPVLLVPEQQNKKPWVAILKDIFQNCRGVMMVTAQRLYRPEEAAKVGGGYWQSGCMRELFFSAHVTDLPAEYVMHKCALHYIPLDKPIPPRKQLPGFIFQRVYDTDMRKVFKFSDKHYDVYSKFLVHE